MTLIVFHKIFPNISHIQPECRKYLETFCEVLSMSHNTVMNLNNVMIFPLYNTWLYDVNTQVITKDSHKSHESQIYDKCTDHQYAHRIEATFFKKKYVKNYLNISCAPRAWGEGGGATQLVSNQRPIANSTNFELVLDYCISFRHLQVLKILECWKSPTKRLQCHKNVHSRAVYLIYLWSGNCPNHHIWAYLSSMQCKFWPPT